MASAYPKEFRTPARPSASPSIRPGLARPNLGLAANDNLLGGRRPTAPRLPSAPGAMFQGPLNGAMLGLLYYEFANMWERANSIFDLVSATPEWNVSGWTDTCPLTTTPGSLYYANSLQCGTGNRQFATDPQGSGPFWSASLNKWVQSTFTNKGGWPNSVTGNYVAQGPHKSWRYDAPGQSSSNPPQEYPGYYPGSIVINPVAPGHFIPQLQPDAVPPLQPTPEPAPLPRRFLPGRIVGPGIDRWPDWYPRFVNTPRQLEHENPWEIPQYRPAGRPAVQPRPSLEQEFVLDETSSSSTNPGSRPRLTPDQHKQMPRKREVKFRVGQGWFGSMLGVAGEAGDLLGVAYKSIPCQGRATTPYSGYIKVNPSVTEKWNAVKRWHRHIDGSAFVQNYIANQIEDYFYGVQGKLGNKSVINKDYRMKRALDDAIKEVDPDLARKGNASPEEWSHAVFQYLTGMDFRVKCGKKP